MVFKKIALLWTLTATTLSFGMMPAEQTNKLFDDFISNYTEFAVWVTKVTTDEGDGMKELVENPIISDYRAGFLFDFILHLRLASHIDLLHQIAGDITLSPLEKQKRLFTIADCHAPLSQDEKHYLETHKCIALGDTDRALELIGHNSLHEQHALGLLYQPALMATNTKVLSKLIEVGLNLTTYTAIGRFAFFGDYVNTDNDPGSELLIHAYATLSDHLTRELHYTNKKDAIVQFFADEAYKYNNRSFIDVLIKTAIQFNRSEVLRYILSKQTPDTVVNDTYLDLAQEMGNPEILEIIENHRLATSSLS